MYVPSITNSCFFSQVHGGGHATDMDLLTHDQFPEISLRAECDHAAVVVDLVAG